MKKPRSHFSKLFVRLVLSCFISASFYACSSDSIDEAAVEDPDKEEPVEEPEDPSAGTEEEFFTNRANQDPLNVVYFVPTDFVSQYNSNEATLKANLSEAMLFAQEWYKKQMELGGYTDKTFALFTRNSNTEVQVITVYGSQSSSQYSNNGAVKAEVETYFQSNPDEVGGSHSLVISNEDTGFSNAGNGKMAFTKSPDNFTMVNTGKVLDGLQIKSSAKYGTLLHELGHALNAPHVAHQDSENPILSIMGGGGANRWDAGGREDEVQFVASSLAIFDVCEAFNATTNNMNYYAAQPDIDFVSYSVNKDNFKQATTANFKFISSVTPKHLYVAMDASPSTVNEDYDKVSYTTAILPTGNTNEYEAELEMLYSDFFDGYQDGNKTDNDIEFSVNILTENGFREVPLTYYFSISSTNAPEPNADINNELFTFSDRSGWTITANSTTPNGNRVAQNMLDADRDSFWYSDWPYRFNESGPHIIEVDLGSIQSFDGLYTYSLNSSNAQFRIKHALIEVSQDGTTYTQALDYTASSINDTTLKMMFESEVTAQYMRITVDEVFKSSANFADNLIINELDIITND